MQESFNKFLQNFWKNIAIYLVMFFSAGIISFKLLFLPYFSIGNIFALPAFYLSSNTTAAGLAAGTLFTASNSGGYSVGSSALVNQNTAGFVAWNWKEDPTSGFDIVSYTGTGANRTVAHSLGATPSFMMVKRTNAAGAWTIYHSSIPTPQNNFLQFDTGTYSTAATVWNNTAPTTSVFSLGTAAQVNANGASYYAYLFAEKPGYSRFGSYTGNGSADGPFAYTGFKPKYIMIKNIDDITPFGTADWVVIDTVRDTSNPISTRLSPSTTGTNDTSDNFLDSNANGFKIRTADGSDGMMNISGDRYVYAAFADYPFERATVEQTQSIASSTRFNGSNTYLNRTPGVEGNLTTWTFSTWYKDVKPTSGQRTFISARGSVTFEGTSIMINSDNGDDTIILHSIWTGGVNVSRANTATLYRDPSVWHHVVVTMDTTQAAASDRVKIWIDNELQTLNGTIPGLNENRFFLNDTFETSVGRYNNAISASAYYNGYLAETYLIDGTALSPTDFGQADSNGNWGPKAYAGGYGTNGFHFDFANNADIGNDVSGNNNDFTNNNLATTDVLYDSPTHNFPVGNYIETGLGTLSQGNLTSTSINKSTVLMLAGKWYWEVKANAGGVSAGVIKTDGTTSVTGVTNGTTSGFRFDADTGALDVTTDGTSYTSVATGLTGGRIAYSSGGNNTLNFGQGGQAGLTYDATADGYFKYTPPAGFKALSSKNMIAANTSAIAVPENYFDIFTYTGNGTAQTFSSLLFSPGFAWIKNRTAGQNHALWGDGTLGATTAVNAIIGWWSEF